MADRRKRRVGEIKRKGNGVKFIIRFLVALRVTTRSLRNEWISCSMLLAPKRERVRLGNLFQK
jgi:hypothetical protein